MTSILLQAQGATGDSSGWILMVGFIAIFYFFMIRPQMKRAKEQKKFQEEIKIGDKVLAAGSIHGEIIELEERTVVLKLDQGRMRIERSALARFNSGEAEKK